MSEWDQFPDAAQWDQFPDADAAPIQDTADPSQGAGTLQIGPIDTGVEIPAGANRFLAGLGKAYSDLWRGIGQIGELAASAPSIEPGMSPEEMEAEAQKVANPAGPTPLQREIDESRRLDAPLMQTGAGIAGNVAGNVALAAPTVFVPGMNTYRGAAAIGGALGALQPVAEGESRAANMAMGAGGGVAGKALVAGAGRVLSPKTSDAARQALQEGVPLTPGQIVGGAGRRIEEGAKSIPVVGDFVRASERKAMEGWNRAALNRVLKPIGQKASKVGREGLEEAHQKVSAAYEKLLPNLKMKVDGALQSDIGQIVNDATSLPIARKDQLVNIIKERVVAKLAPKAGNVPGKLVKEIESDIGRLARDYMKSTDVEARHLGEALTSVKDSLRAAVIRSNPQFKGELGRIDKAYSMLLRVENAGARTGAHEGVFSPAQLKAATRQMDQSLRKRAFAQGKAGMQDFAEAGQEVLGATVPDSGTPFRLTNALMAAGGYAVDPTIAAGMAAGSAAYSGAGRKALEVALARRPELIREAGNALARLGPAGAAAGSTLTRN